MTPELRTRVLTLARETRDWVEQEDLRCEIPSVGLRGWCAIASAHLSRLLARENIVHEIGMSESEDGCHVFVIVGDHVVDVTATQFSEYCRTPILIEHQRLLECCWFHTPKEVFHNADALRKHQQRTGWPITQTAYG